MFGYFDQEREARDHDLSVTYDYHCAVREENSYTCPVCGRVGYGDYPCDPDECFDDLMSRCALETEEMEERINYAWENAARSGNWIQENGYVPRFLAYCDDVPF